MSRTRLQMRSDAYVAAGMSAGVIDTADADQMVVEACGELYDLLVSTFERWYTTSTTSGTTIATGADSFALPVDFLRLVALDYQVGSDWIDVEPFNFGDRNQRNVRGYDIVGSTLYVRPTTLAPGSYRLWYTPRFPGLANDSATFDGINGWEEYAVVDAAIRMRDAEESDSVQLQTRKAALTRRIQMAARQRIAGRSRKPRDVRPGAMQRLLRGQGRWELP